MERESGYAEEMRLLLALMLIVLLLLVGIPMAMGGMADCPLCTSPNHELVLVLCAAILSIIAFTVLLSTCPVFLVDREARGRLVPRDIYRPPRSA